MCVGSGWPSRLTWNVAGSDRGPFGGCYVGERVTGRSEKVAGKCNCQSNLPGTQYILQTAGRFPRSRDRASIGLGVGREDNIAAVGPYLTACPNKEESNLSCPSKKGAPSEIVAFLLFSLSTELKRGNYPQKQSSKQANKQTEPK